jgi:hypothetical protein
MRREIIYLMHRLPRDPLKLTLACQSPADAILCVSLAYSSKKMQFRLVLTFEPIGQKMST